MTFYTPEELKPSEKTLNIIRQLAYTYRAVAYNKNAYPYCVN